MKNIKIKNFVPFLLLIFLGGVFFLFFLIFEYKENIKIIERNKVLLEQNIKERLIFNVQSKANQYPNHHDALTSNWLNYSPEISWFYQKKLIFPFNHTDNHESKWDFYWNAYSKYQTEYLSPESNKRIILLKQLEQSIRQNKKENIKKNLSRFFSHKELFRLSAVEEINSLLRLASIGEWQPGFIENCLIDGFRTGNTHIPSVSELLLIENSLLAREDIEKAFYQISQLSEKANIDYSKIKAFIEKLWQKPLIPIAFPNEGIWLQENQYLVIPKNNNSHLMMPINIEIELNKIIMTLKKQAILNKNDDISIKKINSWVELNQLPISLKKSNVTQLKERQQFYFIGKLFLLLLLMIFIIVAYYFLQSQLTRKQKYLELRENFINLISHELKTPLSSIRLMTETLSKRLSIGKEPRDYPNRILSESEKLWIMVDNILSFNRIQSDLLTLNYERINLKNFISNTINDIDEYVSLSLLCDNNIDSKINIYADKLLIALVFRNLIINAAKYNVNKEVKLHFEFNEESNSLLLSDNGIGIPDSEINKVFEEFYRGVMSKEKSGSGIGLSVSKKIMQLHYGDLSINESNKNGTVWLIRFKNAEN